MKLNISILLIIAGLSGVSHLETLIASSELNSSGASQELPDSNIEKLTHDIWFYTAKVGKIKAIQRLINSGIDVNITDEEGYTALMRAATATGHNHEDIIRLLLSTDNINPNIQSKEHGVTALMSAVVACSPEIVKLILQLPTINVNIQAKSKRTALIWAINRGHLRDTGCSEVVKLLLAMPDININTHGAKLPLEELLQGSSVAPLIKNKIDELTAQAFKAVKDNDLATLKKITSQIVIDSLTDANLPEEASSDSEIDLVKAKAKTGGNTLLDKAFAANQPEIILHILQVAEDPRELLARLPFESISPSCAIFELLVNLAYGQHLPINTIENPQSKDTDTKFCQICAHHATQFCGACKQVYYCSEKCQKSDWENHKQSCKH